MAYPRKNLVHPSSRADIRDAVLRLARENPTWRYQRICGELARGRDPGPAGHGAGHPQTGWDGSRAAPVGAVVGPVSEGSGHVDTVFLKRIYVLFFIEHASRTIHIMGVTTNPTGAWIAQQARNLLMDLGGRAEHVKFVIRDRDAKFTSAFDRVFTSVGARVIKTPVRSPRANAIAERWVGSVRRECTDRLLIYGERHLRRVLAEYERHYNRHRPHRARDQRPPQPPPPVTAPADLAQVRLKRHGVVDGMINQYKSAA
jgi:hypothetical protein